MGDMSPLKAWLDMIELPFNEIYCLLLYLWFILDVELPAAPYGIIRKREDNNNNNKRKEQQKHQQKAMNNGAPKSPKQNKKQLNQKQNKKNKKQNQKRNNKKKPKSVAFDVFDLGFH